MPKSAARSGRQRGCAYAIAAVAAIACLMLLDVRVMVGQPTQSTSVTAPVAARPLDEAQRSFLVKEYETAVEEIRRRLEHEHALFVLKFTLIGGILALLFSSVFVSIPRTNGSEANSPTDPLYQSPIAAAICWVAVLTSAIVDTRLLFNADLIATLGKWIDEEVEQAILGEQGRGWEHYLRLPNALFSSHVYPILRFNVHLLTLLLFVFVMGVYGSKRPRSYREVAVVCRVGVAATFGVLVVVSAHFHYDDALYLGCSVAGGVIGVLVAWKCVWPISSAGPDVSASEGRA